MLKYPHTAYISSIPAPPLLIMHTSILTYNFLELPIFMPINVATEMTAMAANMMLLYKTAWFLLQANSSSDRGDTILQGGPAVRAERPPRGCQYSRFIYCEDKEDNETQEQCDDHCQAIVRWEWRSG